MQEYKDFVPQERKFSCSNINYLLFFLSASHVTLWPWVPLMLYSIGYSLSKIGLVVCLLQIMAVLSVKLSLSSINFTKIGYVRKVILFSFSALSFLFGLTALLRLSVQNSENVCFSLKHLSVEMERNNFSINLKLDVNESSHDSKQDFLNNSNFPLLHDIVPSSKLPYTGNSSLMPLRNTNLNNVPHTNNINRHNMEDVNEREVSINKKEKVFNTFNKNTTHRRNNEINNKGIIKNTYESNSDSSQDSDVIFENYTFYDYAKEGIINNYDSTGSFKQMDPNYRSYLGHEKNLPNNKLSIIPSHQYRNPFIQFNSKNRDEDFHRKDNVQDTYFDEYDSITDQKSAVYNFEHKIEKRYANVIADNSKVSQKGIKQSGIPKLYSYNGFGIVVALSLSVVFGAGIEMAINCLWHCGTCGVPHNNEIFKETGYFLTPPQKLPFVGDHRVWTSCTSCLWLLVTTMAIIVVCSGGLTTSPFKILSVFFFTSESIKCITMLLIDMPYGNACFTTLKTRMGLYLDDEVIKEGLRRISFHGWAVINGIIISLPYFYLIIIIAQDEQSSTKEIWIAQTVTIITLILGEAILLVSNRWLLKNSTIRWTIIMSGLLVATQNIIIWNCTSIWIKSGSALLVGIAKSALWMSIMINSETLGSVEDQQKEAWISWVCFKCGMGIGSIIWTCIADTEWSSYAMCNVLPIAASASIMISCIIGISSSICRTKSERIYHTLDIGGASDDEIDESEINLCEDDWLVKQANKEGYML